MKLNFVFLIIFSSLIACRPFEGTREFNGFDYYRVKPIMTIASSLKLDVTYDEGNIVEVNFKSDSKRVLSDTVIYKNGETFFFQNHPEYDRLSNDSTLRITGRVSDTVRSFIFGKRLGQYELFFVETPLNDSVINIEYVYKSDIEYDSVIERFIGQLTSFRQHVKFYDFAQEITFMYNKEYMYYTTADNYGDWKAIGSTDTLYNVYGSIYLDKYRIEMEDLLPAFKLYLLQEELMADEIKKLK